MKNPKVAVAGLNLARAARLAQQALDAVSKGDDCAVARLIAESREALREASDASRDVLQASTANDDG